MFQKLIYALIITLFLTSFVTASELRFDGDGSHKAIRMNQIWIPMEQAALRSIISNRDSKAPYPFKIGQIWIP